MGSQHLPGCDEKGKEKQEKRVEEEVTFIFSHQDKAGRRLPAPGQQTWGQEWGADAPETLQHHRTGSTGAAQCPCPLGWGDGGDP